ncbi:hypothetical protein HW130_02870 [Streptomyces sp. PKU-EA00015]|uniref:DUF6221 family protein n=1 Tax=Streptomyces sp. PKU-EA00015 TaxID=2748326 RepID=UPI0015A4489C|nr:DUF6221 family protein [Streptomyces sp. PKU-EA00015]NWF25213.1 hypothetical protein [Streptomyces sp. PKU-EA00015]
MTDDLVKFLRARLDEVEARVRALPDGPWQWKTFDDPESDALVGTDGTVLCSGDAEGYKSWIDRHEAFDAYLQDIHPARVVAEVDAKRRIIEDCEGIIVGWHHEESKEFARDVLRNLAEVYADHPDYRDDWRP